MTSPAKFSGVNGRLNNGAITTRTWLPVVTHQQMLQQGIDFLIFSAA